MSNKKKKQLTLTNPHSLVICIYFFAYVYQIFLRFSFYLTVETQCFMDHGSFCPATYPTPHLACSISKKCLSALWKTQMLWPILLESALSWNTQNTSHVSCKSFLYLFKNFTMEYVQHIDSSLYLLVEMKFYAMESMY